MESEELFLVLTMDSVLSLFSSWTNFSEEEEGISSEKMELTLKNDIDGSISSPIILLYF